MPTVVAFKEKAMHISRRLNALSEDGIWQEDLEVALTIQEYTDRQVEAMREAATPSFKQHFNEGVQGFDKGSLPESLAHSFSDPVVKSKLCLEFFGSGTMSVDHRYLLTMFKQTHDTIEEIVHNYPLLLGEEMPGSVRDILDAYRDEILPELKEMIESLVTETGIDPNDIEPATGWEHLHQLSMDIF